MISVETRPPRCSRYVDPFLEETDHAQAPKDERSNEWVNFSINEAGQLNIANRDKVLGKRVLHTCEADAQQAYDEAKKKAGPWYKRLF